MRIIIKVVLCVVGYGTVRYFAPDSFTAGWIAGLAAMAMMGMVDTWYNAASWMLENRQMKERNAELASQPFASLALAAKLGEITDHEREIGIAFARYVATGRTD